jgi:hypothetical protein
VTLTARGSGSNKPKSISFSSAISPPERLVNIYHANYQHHSAELVAMRLRASVLRQLSKTFYKFESNDTANDWHESERNTLVWMVTDTETSLAGLTASFDWVQDQRLPLPLSFNGHKTMTLDPYWKIKQWVALFEVMQYLDLGPQFGSHNVRERITYWLSHGAGEELTATLMIKLWDMVVFFDGLRRSVIQHGAEYAYTECLDAVFGLATRQMGQRRCWRRGRSSAKSWTQRPRSSGKADIAAGKIDEHGRRLLHIR